MKNTHQDNLLEDCLNKGDVQLKLAVGEIIHRISASLPELNEPIKMYLAGGMAVNFYTGYRPTEDVDASFSARLILPKDLVVSFVDDRGRPRMVYFDTNYNTSFALVHPDFEFDSYIVKGNEFTDEKIELRILSPVDLALSKVARFEGNDKEDIAELAHHHLVAPCELEERASEALGYYIGNQSMLLINLREAVEIIRASRGLKMSV